MESLINRLDQEEERVSGLKDKMDSLKIQTIKTKEIRSYEQNMQDIWYIKRPNLRYMGHEEEVEI